MSKNQDPEPLSHETDLRIWSRIKIKTDHTAKITYSQKKIHNNQQLK